MTSTFHVGLALAAAVLVAPPASIAQPPSPPPPNVAAPHPSPDPQAAIKSAQITLTGCLERSKPASAPDKDTAERSIHTDPPSAYVLRAEPGTGTSESAVAFNLIAARTGVRFEEHKGHRVEIRGTIRAATSSQAGLSNHGVSPSTPSGSSGMETTPTPDPIAPGRTDGVSVSQPILVDSLKMLDGGCKRSTE